MTLSCLKFLSRLIRRLKIYSKLVLENKNIYKSATKITDLNFKLSQKNLYGNKKFFKQNFFKVFF